MINGGYSIMKKYVLLVAVLSLLLSGCCQSAPAPAPSEPEAEEIVEVPAIAVPPTFLSLSPEEKEALVDFATDELSAKEYFVSADFDGDSLRVTLSCFYVDVKDDFVSFVKSVDSYIVEHYGANVDFNIEVNDENGTCANIVSCWYR